MFFACVSVVPMLLHQFLLPPGRCTAVSPPTASAQQGTGGVWVASWPGSHGSPGGPPVPTFFDIFVVSFFCIDFGVFFFVKGGFDIMSFRWGRTCASIQAENYKKGHVFFSAPSVPRELSLLQTAIMDLIAPPPPPIGPAVQREWEPHGW